jgi:protein O-mannosyl-transferase
MKKPELIKNSALPFNSVRWLVLVFSLALIAFLPTFINGFTNWDDIDQVTGNTDIQMLSFAAIKKMFTSFYVGMYQPLTTFFYSLIYKLGKLNATWFHAWSMLLHLLNIFLVYLLIFKITKKKTLAIITSLFFAVSPMQTEAIAWVSAMSTLLFTAFFLSSAIIYLQFTETNSWKKYLVSFVLFLFALLSKSAAVTLPLLLLLFDYYLKGKIKKHDLLNKIPFLILAIVFGIITIYARSQSGHIVDMSKYYNAFDKPFLISYSLSYYIVSDLLPLKLSAFHPYPSKTGNFLPLLYYIAPLFLLIIVFFIYKIKSLRKELLFGFLFFAITIAVMIEIIPVGIQIVKERYTYVSCIGLYFIISWIAVKITEKYGFKKIVTLFIVLAGLGFSLISFSRTRSWKDSYTLWDDVIKKYPECSAAYINRGNAFVTDEKYEKAISDFNKAIKYEPTAADAYINRAIAKSNTGEYQDAVYDYDKAIAIGPADDKMYSERAILKLGTEDMEGALEDLSSAIELNPSNDKYYNQRGIIYGMTGKYTEAIADFTKAIELSPEYADAYSNRGYAEINLLQNEDAILDLTIAIEKKPMEARAYYLRGIAYEQDNQSDSACTDLKKAYDLGFTAASEEIEKVCK